MCFSAARPHRPVAAIEPRFLGCGGLLLIKAGGQLEQRVASGAARVGPPSAARTCLQPYRAEPFAASTAPHITVRAPFIMLLFDVCPCTLARHCHCPGNVLDLSCPLIQSCHLIQSPVAPNCNCIYNHKTEQVMQSLLLSPSHARSFGHCFLEEPTGGYFYFPGQTKAGRDSSAPALRDGILPSSPKYLYQISKQSLWGFNKYF
ncbi:hypothetical protein IF1G_06366 [Cordyceps javanica]|uniref:Uncharacterized protein n=1 Tax=Cordyceps javanica TaxID=43265 RepID=A0A545VLC2_9HYPO|nr:hypothetical protein IF1G_06366 [Cordyceps javanica]TQW02527.1 hypothetical protein IF2G_09918 [Cordyceps javanica]